MGIGAGSSSTARWGRRPSEGSYHRWAGVRGVSWLFPLGEETHRLVHVNHYHPAVLDDGILEEGVLVSLGCRVGASEYVPYALESVDVASRLLLGLPWLVCVQSCYEGFEVGDSQCRYWCRVIVKHRFTFYWFLLMTQPVGPLLFLIYPRQRKEYSRCRQIGDIRGFTVLWFHYGSMVIFSIIR